MKIKKVTIAKIIGNTAKSIENWEKQDRPILRLLNKYFTEDDLIEFMTTGNIKRLDNNEISNDKITSHEKAMIDNAIYTAKDKLKRFWGEKWYEVRLFMKKNIKNIVKEIKFNNEIYSIENSKDILIKYTKSNEANQSFFYTKDKKELINKFINDDLSEIEAYAIIEYAEKIFK